MADANNNSGRTVVLDGITKLIDTQFGAGGVNGGTFRKVRRGILAPSTSRPECIVCDAGQKKGGFDDDFESESLDLSVELYLLLADNWNRVEKVEEWTDKVEKLWMAIQNIMIPGCGLLRMKYEDDQPFDVVFTEGATEAAWIIRLTAKRFEPVQEQQ